MLSGNLGKAGGHRKEGGGGSSGGQTDELRVDWGGGGAPRLNAVRELQGVVIDEELRRLNS
jgi:hypothetical protein